MTSNSIHNETLQDKTVLVTGGTGFIGSHLVRRLLDSGSTVVVLHRPSSNRNRLREVGDQIKFARADIRSQAEVARVISEWRPSIVFHLAAQGVTDPYIAPERAIQNNVEGTLNVVRAASQHGITRIINTGTCHEYGDMLEGEKAGPRTAYAASKTAAWSFCNMLYYTVGAPVVTLRLFQVYGPGQRDGLIPEAIQAGLRGADFPTTAGKQVRDWLYIDDAIEAYLRAAVAPEIEGQTFDIGTGQGIPVSDVVNGVFKHFEDAEPIFGALPYRPGEAWYQVADIADAQDALGWSPKLTLDAGIMQTINAIRETPVRVEPGAVTVSSIQDTESTPEQDLRGEILDKVDTYYREVHEDKGWEPGLTRVQYAGRVFDAQEMRHMADSVLDFWLTAGRFSEQFEDRLGNFLGLREVIPVNSGSSANLVAMTTLCSPQLRNRPLKPGDEVITPAVTFPTTLAPIIQNQLIPVLIDSQMGNYNIDVNQLGDALSSRTRAIFAPHTLGNPIDMDILMDFARSHELYVIEDNCDALGSRFDGKLTGTFGHMGTSSFYPAHHITLGEGGAVYTNSRRLAKIARTIRDWGRDCWCGYINPPDGRCGKRFDWELPGMEGTYYDHRYLFTEVGYNLKLTDPQAAVGVAQLDKLSGFIAKRKRNFDTLFRGLKPLEDFLILPTWSEKADPSWFAFPITVRRDAPFTRDDLQRFLEGRNIETRLLFAGNILKQPGYRNINARVIGDLPIADAVMQGTFFVGVYPGLSEPQMEYMLEVFYEFVKSRQLSLA